jgi:hypothetical protein
MGDVHCKKSPDDETPLHMGRPQHDRHDQSATPKPDAEEAAEAKARRPQGRENRTQQVRGEDQTGVGGRHFAFSEAAARIACTSLKSPGLTKW